MSPSFTYDLIRPGAGTPDPSAGKENAMTVEEARKQLADYPGDLELRLSFFTPVAGFAVKTFRNADGSEGRYLETVPEGAEV